MKKNPFKTRDIGTIVTLILEDGIGVRDKRVFEPGNSYVPKIVQHITKSKTTQYPIPKVIVGILDKVGKDHVFIGRYIFNEKYTPGASRKEIRECFRVKVDTSVIESYVKTELSI